MSLPERTVFVCSATGFQGGALARQLRSIGWDVHATTRDLTSASAMALTEIGVQLRQGDWDNTEVLSDSIQGCGMLFLCLLPNWDDPSCEKRQCQNILTLAKAAGVKHVVISTTLGVSLLDNGVDVAPESFMGKHLIAKKALEQAVEDANFEYFTILRPTFFMANFLEPKVKRYTEIRDDHRWTTSMTPETQLPVVDHEDIAKFAIIAFQDPPAFHKRSIGVASEQLRIQELLDLIAEAAGKAGSLKAVFMTDEEIDTQANMSGFSNSHRILRETSKYVDLGELGALVPLTSFKDYLEREKDNVARTYT